MRRPWLRIGPTLFDLIYDWEDPDSFNPTKSLTREEFYAMVRRADSGVEEIDIDKNFEKAVDGPTSYSKEEMAPVDPNRELSSGVTLWSPFV